MKSKNLIFFFLIAVFTVTACKKSGGPDPKAGVDVYVAGTARVSTGKFVATFWKNGIEHTLADSSSNSTTSAIAISGKDVYIIGNSANGAMYWKNGVLVKIFPSANFNAIAVNGNDVYIAGITAKNNTTVAAVWKNGVLGILDGLTESGANGIFVNGNDVYVAGYVRPGNYTAAFWKNGVITNLTDGTSSAEANAICVNNNNIYVAGFTTNSYQSQIATFWKNGNTTMLTGNYYGEANTIFMAGNDLYITGYAQNDSHTYVAKLWKNSVVTDLSNGMEESYTSAVAIHGSDVFVAGFTGNFNAFKPLYWKNGSPIPLSNDFGISSETTGIALVPN